MRLRTQISLLLFMFGLLPLLAAFVINMPMIFDRFEALYHKAHLQNLRADFSYLDQHLARRHEMARLLGHRPATIAEGRAALDVTVERAGPERDEDLLRYFHRHAVREEALMAGALGAGEGARLQPLSGSARVPGTGS